MTKRVTQKGRGEELAAKFAGWLVKKAQNKDWELPQWFETSSIRGFDQKTKKHYYFPGYSKEQELYQTAYTLALELWKENPNQKNSWYYKTAQGRFFDEFYRPTLEYDYPNEKYFRRVPLDDDVEKKQHEAIFGKHFALQPSVDQNEPKEESETRPHFLEWLDARKINGEIYLNKITCPPNCDGTCNHLIDSEHRIHNPLAHTNKCSFCGMNSFSLRHVREDKYYKSNYSLRNDYGIVNNLSIYKNYSSEWKKVCEDCYIENVLGELKFTAYKPPPTKEQNHINPYCKRNCFYTPEQCEAIRNSWKDAFRNFLKRDVIKQYKIIDFYKPGYFKELIPKYNRWGLIQILLIPSPEQKLKKFKHWPIILDCDSIFDGHENLREVMKAAIENVLNGLERDILIKQIYEYKEITIEKKGKPLKTIRRYKTLKDICAELGKDPKTIRKYRKSGESKIKAHFNLLKNDSISCSEE